MRFLHLADVHLDTSFAGRSETVRRRLRQASRDAFRAGVDLAIREDVHALLVAGDLFDDERLSFQTERFLLDEMARLARHAVTVVYATGNHDPGSPDAGPRTLSWPSNVRVVGDATPQRIAVPDARGSTVGYVTAVGHASTAVTDDLSRLLPRPQGELPEVALLHTQVHASPGSEGHHAYAPSELSYLSRSGYDYWALGHVHTRQILSEDPPVVYSGSVQGRTHADSGPRGGYLVDLSDRYAPAISFRPLAPVRWETVGVDGLEEADSLDRLERRIQAAWRGFRAEADAASGVDWMVRIALEGPCPLWRELTRREDQETLARELRDNLGVLDVVIVADGVHPVLPVEEHRARTDVLGAVLRSTEALRRGEGHLTGLEAGELAGLTSDDPEAMDAYVRGLLSGVDGELAARLLGMEMGER